LQLVNFVIHISELIMHFLSAMEFALVAYLIVICCILTNDMP